MSSRRSLASNLQLFYAGKSGGCVAFDKFVQAIDRVVQRQVSGHVEYDKEGNALQFGSCGNEYLFYKSHGNMDWNIKLTHTSPETFTDRMAFRSVKMVRFLFDWGTGWNGVITPDKVLNRTIYLETIAAVHGMVTANICHCKSLRTMQQRMHLLISVRMMKDPGVMLRQVQVWLKDIHAVHV